VAESSKRIHQHTQALCPQCRAKVQARVVEMEEKVYLEKFCPTHGQSRALISSDVAWYRNSLNYVKPRQLPLQIAVQEFRGCPESCGSCPEHQQHTCLPVIEITSRCDLSCPVCLKDLQQEECMSRQDFAAIVDNLIRCEGRIDVLNLSGGEPTLHPQLIDFLHLLREKGVVQSTVSTNGLRFLKSADFLRDFKETGAIVALQFDGFRAATYEKLRGRDLAQEKKEIIALLEEEGIPYSLVATIARSINEEEVTEIVDYFFASRAVSLMLQPISLTGEAEQFDEAYKLTIPDLVQAIERSEYVNAGDFNPLPCSHFSCFALAYYFVLGDGRFLSMKEFLGVDEYLDVIANKTLPGLDSAGFESIRNRLYDVWSLCDADSLGEQALKRIQQVLREVSSEKLTPQRAFNVGARSMKAIFIHDFMDVTNLDFARLIKCCNPYPQSDGRLVPICAQNVFYQG
jgi:uncharacterized radical SAM superfamily Fe-S cluster-containing enzyme